MRVCKHMHVKSSPIALTQPKQQSAADNKADDLLNICLDKYLFHHDDSVCSYMIVFYMVFFPLQINSTHSKTMYTVFVFCFILYLLVYICWCWPFAVRPMLIISHFSSRRIFGNILWLVSDPVGCVIVSRVMQDNATRRWITIPLNGYRSSLYCLVAHEIIIKQIPEPYHKMCMHEFVNYIGRNRTDTTTTTTTNCFQHINIRYHRHIGSWFLLLLLFVPREQCSYHIDCLGGTSLADVINGPHKRL